MDDSLAMNPPNATVSVPNKHSSAFRTAWYVGAIGASAAAAAPYFPHYFPPPLRLSLLQARLERLALKQNDQEIFGLRHNSYQARQNCCRRDRVRIPTEE